MRVKDNENGGRKKNGIKEEQKWEREDEKIVIYLPKMVTFDGGREERREEREKGSKRERLVEKTVKEGRR